MNAVEIRNVTKTFGKHVAVGDLSLDVPKGCVYGFIGPNGSGKTTTMRMIMNILYPDSGFIKVLGEQSDGASTDLIGYMPEERGLYKKMKVRELLEFYGNLKNGENVKQEVSQWLERLELKDWADKKVEALSKGMSQKVQFISTIVSRPEILILDEPFTGLDPVNTNAIREAVLDLKKGSTTVILSTHDMNVAERMCDFIFMIFKGRKVLDGTLASIQDEYSSDTIRLRSEGSASAFKNLEGVKNVTNFGQVQEVQVAGDRDPQEIVSQIMSRIRVQSFELTRPSLHDIFVRIAGSESQEVEDA